jgi:iron complex outermembrane receptor protein
MQKLYLFIRCFSILLLLGFTPALAQTKTVTGKVTAADDGSALPGVNILEKGTNNGAITSVDGTYSITVNENAVLAFSFVGYQTAELSVGTQNTLNVALQSDVTALTEVVVIGYGEVRRRDATGAVASVKSEDFNVGVISSPEQLIQGKTAGVQITSASGEPGAGVNIRIRGTSSVRGGNNPLFVVDGIPLTSSDVSAGGADIGRGTSSARNPLNFINPSDIESMDVLKDASATAIYGSRGANGVVIITTKSGKGKKRNLEYSTNLSFSRMAKKFDLLDRDQFLYHAGRLGADVDALDYGANTDWQDAISRTAVSHRHDLSFSNNYKDGNYRLSVSYDNQLGVIKNSALERITGRLNLNHTVFSKLTLGTQLTFSRVNDQAPPISNNAGFEGDLIGATYMANPTWPRFADSQFSNTNANPLAMLKYSQDNTGTNRALINVSLGYDILPGLNFKVNTGFDRSESTREGGLSPKLFLSSGVFENGRAFASNIETSSDLLEAFFNYQKTIAGGSLSAVLGYSYQEFSNKGRHHLGWGFNNDNIDGMIGDLNYSSTIIRDAIGQPYQQFGFDDDRFFINSLEAGVPLDIGERPASTVRSVFEDNFETVDELQSFFGRVNYSIKDKYLFTATFRADGSTRFGGDNKYGYFPSGAFAWRLSEEAFMPDFFDDLKLRLGYGVTGNQEIPHNLHQGRQRFIGLGQPSGPSIENGGNINPPGLRDVAYKNDKLQWEQTSQLNAGLDFSFADTKISGSIDYYRKVTTDLLIQITSAQPAPQPFTWTNLDADVINSGVEFTLNYYAIDTDNTNLEFSINGAYNKNVVQDFNGIIDTGSISGQGLTGAFAQRIVDGEPLYAYYIREFLGFDQNGLSIYNGDFQRFLGKSPIPKYNLGFSINLRMKNWDFSTFLTGQFGHYVYNNTANAFFSMGSLGNGRNVTEDVVYIGESNLNAPDVSTRFLEKGDFLRMQNLVIGYNFKLGESGVKKLRLFASGQNVFVITPYSGLDPEVNINKSLNDVPSMNIDYVGYPRPRTLTLGLSVGF